MSTYTSFTEAIALHIHFRCSGGDCCAHQTFLLTNLSLRSLIFSRMNAFTARLNAVEGSYFQTEQNNATKKHLELLVEQGKLPASALEHLPLSQQSQMAKAMGQVPVTIINSRPASEVCIRRVIHPLPCSAGKFGQIPYCVLYVQVIFSYTGVPGEPLFPPLLRPPITCGCACSTDFTGDIVRRIVLLLQCRGCPPQNRGPAWAPPRSAWGEPSESLSFTSPDLSWADVGCHAAMDCRGAEQFPHGMKPVEKGI